MNKPTFLQKLWKAIATRQFLFISIGVHAIFLIIATGYVVKTIVAQRKLTFASAPPFSNPGQKATEHKVNLAKKHNSMSSPAQSKRIATTGPARVALPDAPTVSMPSMMNTGKMAGRMGGGSAEGLGLVGGVKVAAVSASAIPFFGVRTQTIGLIGTFYDFKQDKDSKPTPMAGTKGAAMDDLSERDPNWQSSLTAKNAADNGFTQTILGKFFKGPSPLYTTQIYIPPMKADDGPKAFGLEDKVLPRRWIIVYRGEVTAPVGGTYRFLGCVDDWIAIRFNNKLVLSQFQRPERFYPYEGVEPPDKWAALSCLTEGEAINVRAGQPNKLEIMIGECPGGIFKAFVHLKKEGETYERSETHRGCPKFPIFKLAPSEVPETKFGPPIGKDTDWSIWRGKAVQLQ